MRTATTGMLAILRAPESDEDERVMALHTLAQVFFPERDDCSATLEHLDECAVKNQKDGQSARDELDQDEATFSEKLARIMEEKGISQTELARRTDLGQPAISMMLSRNCRPQQRTVRRLAEALGVGATELWPVQADRARRLR
jgi:lambda repressor-like predicted transcriptional regulator